MNETIEFKSGQQGYLEYKSSNPFEFYHILNELDKAPQIDAKGWLIFPEKGKGPFPVIFCVHGSDNWAGHHHEHILNFLEAGFAIFKYIALTREALHQLLKIRCLSLRL